MSDRKRFLLNVFHPCAGEIAAYLRGRWHNEANLADIVQESCPRLSQYAEPEDIRNPRAFLFHRVSNFLVGRRRRHASRDRFVAPDVELEPLADAAEPENPWADQEALERFTELLEQLPELRRHAFVLFRIEGLSHGEIAAHLGISVRSSERHVMMAMRHISRHLGPIEP